jgi:hypothetical protein
MHRCRLLPKGLLPEGTTPLGETLVELADGLPKGSLVRVQWTL